MAANPSALALGLYALASVSYRDDPDAALALLQESVALTEGGASDVVLGDAYELVASIYCRRSDANEALGALSSAVRQSDRIGTRVSAIGALTIGVEVFATTGHVELAAVLNGIITDGPFASLVGHQGGRERDEREHLLAEVRNTLDDETYETAVQRGASMSYEEIIDFVLGEIDRIRSTPMPAS